MPLRPPKGVKGEFDLPVGAGGMARFVTRRGLIRSLQRIMKRHPPKVAKELVKQAIGKRKGLPRINLREILSEGKASVGSKTERLRRSMTK